MAARKSTKKQIMMKTLKPNQNSGGNQWPISAGPCQPPKNNVTIMQEININPRYSPSINIANFMPPYSV
jgi:hypothetical protein